MSYVHKFVDVVDCNNSCVIISGSPKIVKSSGTRESIDHVVAGHKGVENKSTIPGATVLAVKLADLVGMTLQYKREASKHLIQGYRVYTVWINTIPDELICN